jgi:hypothetical protein
MQSLIDKDRQQMELPLPTSDQMDDAFFLDDEAGPSREFTGARLFSKHPETYKAIVALSAEGLGAIRIGRILAVSPNTVLAVRSREGVNVDIEKKRISNLSRAAARMCVEGIVEMLCDPDRSKEMSLRDRGIVFGILAEKAELLSGAPTARIAVDSSDVELSEYLKWLRSEHAKQIGLEAEKREEKAVEAEVVEHGRQPASAALVAPRDGGQEIAQAGAYPAGSEGLAAPRSVQDGSADPDGQDS